MEVENGRSGFRRFAASGLTMRLRRSRKRGRAPMKRRGLRVSARFADPEVRRAALRFSKWLRMQFEFPIRVTIYLSKREQIRTSKGEAVSASFFAPNSRAVEPFIRVATGDYSELKNRWGRDEALAAILASIAHEVVHYQQWRDERAFSEREAVNGARRIVRRYGQVVERP